MATRLIQIFSDPSRVRAAINEIATLGYSTAGIGVLAKSGGPLASRLRAEPASDKIAVSSPVLDRMADYRFADVGEVTGAGWLLESKTADEPEFSGIVDGSSRLSSILSRIGTDKSEAKIFGEAIRRGDTLVGVVSQNDDDAGSLKNAMQKFGGRDAARCGADYRASGWAG